MEVFNISLPTSWDELSNKQLLMVYGLFARDLSAAEVKTLCLMKWNGLKVLASLPDKRFLIKREKEPEVALSTRQIQQATSVLDFLADNIGQSFVGVVAKALDDKTTENVQITTAVPLVATMSIEPLAPTVS